MNMIYPSLYFLFLLYQCFINFQHTDTGYFKSINHLNILDSAVINGSLKHFLYLNCLLLLIEILIFTFLLVSYGHSKFYLLVLGTAYEYGLPWRLRW